MPCVSQIFVVSLQKILIYDNNSDSYSSKLAQHFTKGAKEAGIEVETISLGAKTMEEAYEIGKRLSIPAKKETFTIPQSPVRLDVRVQKMILVLGRKILPAYKLTDKGLVLYNQLAQEMKE